MCIMSMNMSGDGGTVDYSDFRYDQFLFEVTAEPQSDGQINVNTAANAEPLSGIGGLQTNEVAELVYMELQAHIEFDDESGDQDVASDGEFRGTFGINIDDIDEVLLGASGDEWSQTDVNEADGSLVREASGELTTEDRTLQVFQANGALPSDDEANGAGSNGANIVQTYEKNWRQLTGRGPVLDANDDLGVASRLIVNDTVLECSGVLHGHLVYDVAEVEDAGRAFSVPRK